MPTFGVIAEAQGSGQTGMQIDVVHPPFRSLVQTPLTHVRATQTGMHGVQNHASVANGQS